MAPQSYPTVSLNIDIMHIIMSYADRRVISNLMKTCHTLNSEGTRYLLADGVTLQREVGVVSFIVWFFQARGDSSERFRRLTFVDKLTIDFYPSPPEYINHILEGFFEIVVRLGAASNLTSLKISRAEALFTTHPPLAAAIAKLTTLKTLDLSFTGVHGATLLRTLQSSLVTVTVSFGLCDREREHEVIPEPDKNPILLLEGSQSTLESLETSFAVTLPDGPCYANVTRLDLWWIDLPYIEDYIRAFPNLLSLKAFECVGYRTDPGIWNARRETTMLYQAQYGTWQSLRHFQGSMLILWIWGLTCQIPSVSLHFEQEYGVDPNFLNDIILDVRPSHLALRLRGASSLLDDAVRTVLSEEGRLQALELSVLLCMDKDDDTVSIGRILVSQISWFVFEDPVSLKWLFGVAGSARRCRSGVLRAQVHADLRLVLHENVAPPEW